MTLAEAIEKARSAEPDSHKATVTIDESWVSERVGAKGKAHVLTHSPGAVSLDYLREHIETAKALPAGE